MTGPKNPTSWADYGAYSGHVFGFDADVGGPVQQLTSASLGANTSYRPILYIEPTHSGRQVAFVHSLNSNIRYAYYENVGYVGNIDFDAAGALQGTPFMQLLETTGGGRVSGSIAHDFTRTKLYYAYLPGVGGDEAQKKVIEARFDTTDGGFTKREVNSTPKRYNVLHAGRWGLDGHSRCRQAEGPGPGGPGPSLFVRRASHPPTAPSQRGRTTGAPPRLPWARRRPPCPSGRVHAPAAGRAGAASGREGVQVAPWAGADRALGVVRGVCVVGRAKEFEIGAFGPGRGVGPASCPRKRD